MKMTEQMTKARKFAEKEFGPKTYGKGKPYMYHLMGVAQMVDCILDAFKISDWSEAEKENLYTAAILHDILEDTKVELLDLGIHLGKDVAKLVQMLTHKKEDSYLDYILNITDVNAMVIKLSDLRFNIQESEQDKLPDRYCRQRKSKYELAEYILAKRLKGAL